MELNKYLRRVGLVLVVSHGNEQPTRLWIETKWRYERRCSATKAKEQTE